MSTRTTITGARARCQNGSAMVELCLLAPWIFFLFVGVMDAGFLAYSVICTQNAARAAATQTAFNATSQADVIACNAALNELKMMPNVVGVTTCTAAPVIVSRKTLCDQTTVDPKTIVCEGANPADSSQDATSASSQVGVTYTTVPLIGIPGVLKGTSTFTRIAEMRILWQ